MKLFSIFFLLLILSSCALKPVIITDKFTIELDHVDTSELIIANAQKCWARDFHFFKGDAFIVEVNNFIQMGTLITVRRSAPDISYQKPFINVLVKPIDKITSSVEIHEGSCALGCYMDFTPDVARWLDGDQTCKKDEDS